MKPFKFNLNTAVIISCSGETGTVIARAEYLHSESSYLVHYRSVDGRAVEQWWGESTLQ